MPETSLKAQASACFDLIVTEAPVVNLNPWELIGDTLAFAPDYETLGRLLGVPLLLKAPSQSGVPSLALDVWTAYELRRAGFDPDRVWPRTSDPRVLPWDVLAFVDSLPSRLRLPVWERLARGQTGGTSGASANLLGKNYVKQVDVVMSSWQTGPELLISTKRMDSSFGKNAANRIEESYGDAKNLSLRHPQAALGFLYGLRSTAYDEEPDTAAWIMDLLAKLGREDDAYDAVGLVVPQWRADVHETLDKGGDGESSAAADLNPTSSTAQQAVDVTARLESLPRVVVRTDLVPEELSPARFFEVMISTVLTNSPINFHRVARKRMAQPRQ